MPTRYPDGAARSHGFGTPNRTCLEGMRKGLQDLTGKEHQIATAYGVSRPGGRVSRVRDTRAKTPTRYQDGAAGSYGFGTTDSICLQGIRSGLQVLTGMLMRYHHRAAGSHGFGTPDRKRLRGIRTGLQDLTGSDQKIQHAYKVSGRDCRISRVLHIRPNLPTRYKVGVAGSHGSETPDRTHLRGFRTGLHDLTGSDQQIQHAYNVSGRDCRNSSIRHTRSNMSARYQDGAAGSHGLGTPDRTCLQGIRTGMQDLTGKEHQIEHAYKVSGRGCRISRVGNYRLYVGMDDLTGKEQQFQHAYEVTGQGCRISRVRHIRSTLPTRFQVGVAGSHGLGTTDRTCLQGNRRGLQVLTSLKHQNERAYYVAQLIGISLPAKMIIKAVIVIRDFRIKFRF